MKKVIQILAVLLLLGLAYLAIAGRELQTVKTEIEIQAPVEEVWGIVADINQWQNWTPTINVSQGDGSVDSTLLITMMSDEAGKDGPTYNPQIIQMDEPYYFHWRAQMLASFVFTNEKIIELEKTNAGTKVTHSETFQGMMAALMKSRMDEGVRPMLDMMNQALKQKAEL